MTDLRQAAQAVIDRWDSPKWEWSQQGPTADLIAALRIALEQKVSEFAQAQEQAEPVVLWQKRHPLRTEGAWKNTDEDDAKFWGEKAQQGWEIRFILHKENT